MKNNIRYGIAGSVLLGSLLLAGTAFAAGPGSWQGGMGGRVPGVFGTVSSISGTTLTVTSKGFGQNAAQTAYTVDASNATVTKNGSASTLSNVSVGDTVMVQGTVSGTNVTATSIRDGMMGRMGKMSGGQKPNMGIASHTPAIQGNGQPVVGGNVTAVSGNSLTVTNKSNVTYTVDATNATISKTGVASATISNVAVGDSVVIQGTVNGTSIIAASVIDSGMSSAASGSAQPKPRSGFMSAIGGFFSHLFGFF